MADETNPPGERGKDGRFLPGNSGGPGRKRLREDVREMLEVATPHAAKRLVEALDATVVAHYKGEEVGTYVDHNARMAAAQLIMDRLYGKPAQTVSGEDGGPIAIATDIMPALLRLAGVVDGK